MRNIRVNDFFQDLRTARIVKIDLLLVERGEVLAQGCHVKCLSHDESCAGYLVNGLLCSRSVKIVQQLTFKKDTVFSLSSYQPRQLADHGLGHRRTRDVKFSHYTAKICGEEPRQNHEQ